MTPIGHLQHAHSLPSRPLSPRLYRRRSTNWPCVCVAWWLTRVSHRASEWVSEKTCWSLGRSSFPSRFGQGCFKSCLKRGSARRLTIAPLWRRLPFMARLDRKRVYRDAALVAGCVLTTQCSVAGRTRVISTNMSLNSSRPRSHPQILTLSCQRKFPRLLWNTKFYHRIHGRSSLKPVMFHLSEVETLISCFSSQIHFNISLPHTPR